MKMHKLSELTEGFSAERMARIDKRVAEEMLELNLRSMRELVGKTQVQAAKRARMTQSELSKIEHREDYLLSTLKRYVKALGGEVDVIARFGDKSVRLKGV